jgi:CRISPR-associated protein Cas1
MIKRIVAITQPSYLSLKNSQMVIKQDDEIKEQIAVEDIGVIILEHSAILTTQPLIIACSKNNTIIVFCDEKHLPYSTILPIAEGNNLHQKILKQQLSISEPKRKNLWQQVVKQKILNQAQILKKHHKNSQKLLHLSTEVKSGDATNREAVAAKYYWTELFGKNFVRDVDLEGINQILNYGYSLIRASIARAIVAGGLHPSVGIFHHNQYNALCLADDLMEPFRPWVDDITYHFYQQNKDLKLTMDIKSKFMLLLSDEVSIDSKITPLMVGMHYFIANLKRCYIGEDKKLIFPSREE